MSTHAMVHVNGSRTWEGGERGGEGGEQVSAPEGNSQETRSLSQERIWHYLFSKAAIRESMRGEAEQSKRPNNRSHIHRRDTLYPCTQTHLVGRVDHKGLHGVRELGHDGPQQQRLHVLWLEDLQPSGTQGGCEQSRVSAQRMIAGPVGIRKGALRPAQE